MHIVHITSELTPVAKVGGLGDVIYGLSKEIMRLGHTVEIILPKYDCLHYEELENLKVEQKEVGFSEETRAHHNTIWSADVHGIKVLLVESHHTEHYFNRDVIYGCKDDIDRFIHFSKTAMEYLVKSKKQPDVIHVHDWPTAIIPVLYKEMYAKTGYQIGGTLLTIHNMEHQGKCLPLQLSRVGLKGESYLSPDKMQDPKILGDINLLKGGIVYADAVTTVSPTYEKEIQTIQGGCGLHETLISHRKKLKGILNGIDEDFWNPEKDSHLIKPYPAHRVDGSKLPRVLAGKKENKDHLKERLGLKKSEAPLVAVVTRLVPQKSPELIKYALESTLKKGGQFVLLGSTPIPSVHREFAELQARLKNNENAAILLDKDEALAHQIFAAADMFIIPSLFEPCGLTQLIAQRYGTIPIVRVTGGLADTVFDGDTSTRPLNERNGFTFDFSNTDGVDWALSRALECYKRDKEKWQSLMLNGMRKDFSWKHTAPEYVSLYKELQPSPAVSAEKSNQGTVKQ